jgi:hypothetical protein
VSAATRYELRQKPEGGYLAESDSGYLCDFDVAAERIATLERDLYHAKQSLKVTMRERDAAVRDAEMWRSRAQELILSGNGETNA